LHLGETGALLSLRTKFLRIISHIRKLPFIRPFRERTLTVCVLTQMNTPRCMLLYGLHLCIRLSPLGARDPKRLERYVWMCNVHSLPAGIVTVQFAFRAKEHWTRTSVYSSLLYGRLCIRIGSRCGRGTETATETVWFWWLDTI
jgi:hypothetical protein